VIEFSRELACRLMSVALTSLTPPRNRHIVKALAMARDPGQATVRRCDTAMSARCTGRNDVTGRPRRLPASALMAYDAATRTMRMHATGEFPLKLDEQVF
jgi:hypothetical protein